MAGYRTHQGNKTTNRDAFTISKKLRTAGYSIQQSSNYGKKEGTFVKGPNICIVFDYDVISDLRKELAEEIAQLLETWGYTVERSDDPESLTIRATK